MGEDFKTTAPKPFIFVLMPFTTSFDDIYKFGIKGAAQEVGAYAERIDEQIFSDGILDRIYNQIYKADIIVADMTGRNPNVFYEVGYAHALGKIVLLLTQDANDIPFDLKNRQHTIYGGSIEKLRKELVEKLHWALTEAKTRKEMPKDDYSEARYLQVFLKNVHLQSAPIGITGRTIRWSDYENDTWMILKVEVRNPLLKSSPHLESANLFLRPNCFLKPALDPGDGPGSKLAASFILDESEAPDGLVERFPLPWNIPSLPSNGWHTLLVLFVKDNSVNLKEYIPMRIRLHYSDRHFDYPFVLDYDQRAARPLRS
jgi:hypothetical protein